jgi:hypothetical protein
MDNVRAADAATGHERQIAQALAVSCERAGVDLSDDAAYAGFHAALVTATSMFKGYLANGLVEQDTYDLVVATAAALIQGGDHIREA